MRNGIVDIAELNGMAKSIDKIVKLRKEYDSKATSISINSRISIEFDPHFKTCYICVNGNKVIKYIYGNIRATINSAATGATFGIIKSPIKFVTTDKTVVNRTFIKETSIILKYSIGKIENDLREASKAKWGIN